MKYIISESQMGKLRMWSYIQDTINSYEPKILYYYDSKNYDSKNKESLSKYETDWEGLSFPWDGYGGDPVTEYQRKLVSKIGVFEKKLKVMYQIVLPGRNAIKDGYDYDKEYGSFKPFIIMSSNLYENFNGLFGSLWEKPFSDWVKDYYNINDFGFMKYVEDVDLEIIKDFKF